MKKVSSLILGILITVSALAWERVPLWPNGKMPDKQDHQIAAMTNEVSSRDFNPKKHASAYLEWFEAPAPEVRNGACMILISGGSYQNCCDVGLIDKWHKELTALGFQCVNFVYRTPRPEGLPIYQSAWEDGQRAVRKVRSEAAKRGFDPDRIGVISMSAGSHLALMLATSSLTPAYKRVDALDDIPCNINWAIVNAPAYATTDALTGIPASRQGYGSDVALSPAFKFDAQTCPMSLHHGGKDPYSPNGSTLVYRQLRKMGVPAELHIYPDKGHGAFGFERGVEFMRQMGFMGSLQPEEKLMDRYSSDDSRSIHVTEDVWPEGKMPDADDRQCKPYLEWHIPAVLKTRAIQVIYSGGSYKGNNPDDFEVAPARRYLNEKGMAVVTLKYRTPRPSKESGLSKHTAAWQDLQRAIRIVRSEAASYGLDPERIGIMGSSAGGHLTLMGVTSSLHESYRGIDAVDKLPCNVQWGVGIYPAYALTDGADAYNTTGGNDDSAVLVPEFSFDLATAPMLLIHGDADGWASMNSVKTWEKMRSMGIQSELHTLATRPHCFQKSAAPGTGSYTYLDRIWEFLGAKGFTKEDNYSVFYTHLGDAPLEQKLEMAAHLVPTPQQVDWQKCELTAFVHFTVNTFTGREWGDGKEPETVFNPTELNTDQWCKALSDAGFRMVILTAKHHDGFCLWPSKVTEHSVKNSPWLDGKGDVVAMLRKSCDKYGLKMGVYLSPWDRNAECYGTGEAYNEFFRAQLTELLSNYGRIDEVWFDGANGSASDGKYQEYDWQSYMDHIKKLQPDAVTAIQGDEIRWVGNEAGKGREAEWSPNVLPPATFRQAQSIAFKEGKGDVDPTISDVDAQNRDLGSRSRLAEAKDLWWRPAEVDVSIRPGWFYHENQDNQVKSLEKLQEIYFSSVGQNAVLLLNIPPDKRGLFHENDVKVLADFGKWKEETFARDLKGSSEAFDIIMIQEDITRGQRVEKFHVEISKDGKTWETIASGTTIGYKRLIKLDEPVCAKNVRYVIDETRAPANISAFCLYKSR